MKLRIMTVGAIVGFIAVALSAAQSGPAPNPQPVGKVCSEPARFCGDTEDRMFGWTCPQGRVCCLYGMKDPRNGDCYLTIVLDCCHPDPM